MEKDESTLVSIHLLNPIQTSGTFIFRITPSGRSGKKIFIIKEIIETPSYDKSILISTMNNFNILTSYKNRAGPYSDLDERLDDFKKSWFEKYRPAPSDNVVFSM